MVIVFTILWFKHFSLHINRIMMYFVDDFMKPNWSLIFYYVESFFFCDPKILLSENSQLFISQGSLILACVEKKFYWINWILLDLL